MADTPVDFESWRIAAEVLPTVVFSARPDGSVEFVNRRWTELTGHAASSALGDAWRTIVHPDDLEYASSAWRHSLESGDDMSLECRIRRADGTYRWVITNAAAMRDAQGAVARWFGTVHDIDRRKHAEGSLGTSNARLEDSERKFRALANAIPVICWTADAQGWIDWYNNRWFEFTGQTNDEALGWGWQAAHHPDDFLDVMRSWPRSIETGESFEMEFRLRRHDGVFHWFLTRIEPLRDTDGKIIRWYGSHIDIDAQKNALERTKRVAETLQEVFLPKHLPQYPDIRLDALYLPAEKDSLVGGDWFDAVALPDGRLMFSIGDVAGHGLHASALVGRIRQAIFTLAFKFTDPAMILKETDRILSHQEPDIMVSALVGFVNATHTTINYANAGHPPPIVAYRSDSSTATQPFGEPPLGIGSEQDYMTHEIPLHPDAVVALYTDGMIEFSRDLDSAEAKLRTAVALLVGNTSIARPALAVQEIVFDGMPPKDDAALLLMQFSAVDMSALRSRAVELEKTWRFHSSDAQTAHVSRHEIVAFLKQMAAEPEQVFAGELVLGELLANTVEHAPGIVEVHVDWTGARPIVTVRDVGPGLVNLNRDLPEDILQEHGRGVYLIKTLADEASVRRSPGYGAEVRAVLPITRKPAAPDDARNELRRE
ncbi:MAG TPA: PAS domain-containing protein [Candidatus Eremiobacteraceae bacterium]|jgi:PAS domain S-box-containing protein